MTPRDRRALVLGAGVMLAFVMALRVAPATIRRSAASRAAAVERLGTLARARDLIEREADLRDSLHAALGGFLALAPRLVAGGTRADAAASLASWLGGAAARSAVKVRRIESLPDSATGHIQPVVVRAELEGDIAGISGLLRDVETGVTLLSVAALSLTALDPAAAPNVREVLRLELSVRGWFHAREAP